MTQRLLPDGWVETTLGDTSDYIRGVTYKKEHSSLVEKPDFLPILRANNIQNGQIILDELVYVHKDLIQQKQLIQNEDIVIAMSSGSKSVVGKAAQVLKDFNGSFGAFCGVLRPKANINSRFVRHLTQTTAYRNQISNLSAGANINNLKPAYFYQIPIPLPPLAEQHHIAKLLDDSLAMAARIRERLDSVQQQLKRFRQSVLADAVSGRLTNLESMPVATLKNIAQINPKKDKLPDELLVSFSPMNLMPTNYGEKLRYEPRNWHEVKKGFTFFKNNDVLVAKITPCFENSKSVIATDLINGYGTGSTEYHVVRCSEKVLPEWVFLYFKTTHFLQQGALQMTGSVGHKRVPKDYLENLTINLPPLPEQQEIVRRVDALFAHAEQIEQRMTVAMAQVEQLVQSLLAAAFDGSLSRAWRDANQALITGEHSAAALLAQITQQPSTKARTKKSTKTAINPV